MCLQEFLYVVQWNMYMQNYISFPIRFIGFPCILVINIETLLKIFNNSDILATKNFFKVI